MNDYPLAITLLLTYFLSTCAFGTCIVIVRTDKEIIVGADSKRLNQSDFTKGNGNSDNVSCKIRQSGKFYFALSGFHDQLQADRANYVCARSTTIEQVKVRFAQVLKTDFESGLEEFRLKHLNYYKSRFVNTDIANIAFFLMENNEPQLVTLSFRAVNSVTEKVKVNVHVDINSEFTILGSPTTFWNMTKPELEKIFSLKETNPILFVQQSIQYVIKHRPNGVGEPIDILQLNSNGINWIYKKENC